MYAGNNVLMATYKCNVYLLKLYKMNSKMEDTTSDIISILISSYFLNLFFLLRKIKHGY